MKPGAKFEKGNQYARMRNGVLQPKVTPEERKARAAVRQKQRYAEKRDELLKNIADYYAANPDKKKAVAQRYINKHRDRLNAEARAKYQTPERQAYIKAYAKRHRAENKDLYISYQHKRRQRLEAAVAAGDHTEEEWTAKLEEYGRCCAYCSSKKKITRDHQTPLARGGTNAIDNIVPACSVCNSKKGTLTADEFRARDRKVDERWGLQLAAARASRFRKMGILKEFDTVEAAE